MKNGQTKEKTDMETIKKNQKVNKMEKEKERLKFCIDRYDHYYDSINNKSNVYLTLSVFVFGGILGLYPTMMKNTNNHLFVNILMLIILGLGLTIMLITILASRPYLTNETDSVFFFQSVSNMGKDNFIDCSESISNEQEIEDLRIQTYQLAKGLKAKFSKLHLVATLFAIQFMLFIPLTILVLTHLK